MTDRAAGPDDVLLTKGIKSTVYDVNDLGEPAGRFGRYGCGHVALLDWDDHVAADDVGELLEEAAVGGPTLTWASSAGNLHGWNMTVRPWAESVDVLRRLDDDTGHLRVGKERGWWRLRCGPKLTKDSDRYKPRPEPLRTHLRPADGPVSRPHAALAEKLTDGAFPGPDELEADGYDLRGRFIETAVYSTFTDEGKALQRAVVEGGNRGT